MSKKTVGINTLYAKDATAADRMLWGRRTDPSSRRGFLKKAGLAAMSGFLGLEIPFWKQMPGGMIPALLAQSTEDFVIQGKEDLVVLNDRPLNAETPAHLLDDAITPASRLFVRNNGIPPARREGDPLDWKLEIAGEACASPQSWSLRQLKSQFQSYTYRLQLECGGNGRSEYNPPATGNQWTVGAVGCPEWTGVRLKDVLRRCGIMESAVYVAYYGADRHLSGDPDKVVISRGVPIAKALEDETLVAWSMNGRELPDLHGYPIRLVAGGWPASVSGKWLTRLVIRDRIHDGPKMLGQSYRVPCKSVAPGSQVPDEDMCIIESMPVKSLVTSPRSGLEHPLNEKLRVGGKAWAGDLQVATMFVSIDFGATWEEADLEPPANRLSWQTWSCAVRFPRHGYYEVWARAVDTQGRSQPMVLPGWNPRGYLNNACHRIAVQVV